MKAIAIFTREHLSMRLSLIHICKTGSELMDTINSVKENATHVTA